MSLYLMKELAFDVWKPTALDLKLMSHWLINYSVGAIESQTCRFVIQSMNWAFDDKGELFLPSEIHLKVSMFRRRLKRLTALRPCIEWNC